MLTAVIKRYISASLGALALCCTVLRGFSQAGQVSTGLRQSDSDSAARLQGFLFKPGLTLGAGYQIQRPKTANRSVASEHRILASYSLTRGSVALEYRYTVRQLLGPWNLVTRAKADLPYVANYFGTGNETLFDPDLPRRFYRYRRTGLEAGLVIDRPLGAYQYLQFHGALQRVDIKNDEDRFITKAGPSLPGSPMDPAWFAGLGFGYRYKKSDHPLVPRRGTEFNVSAGYTRNLTEPGRSFSRYASSASLYIPFLQKLSLAIRAGGTALGGQPAFYQLAVLGGHENLRGHRRERFYGKTAFYNNNELRLILDARGRLFTGKYGLLAFLDQGRVWQPGELSERWHLGYGGGIFVAPSNKFVLNFSYGISSDDRLFHLRAGFLF